MIGLLFLIGIGTWLVLARSISVKIPGLIGATKHRTAVVFLSFPVILVAPFADELIGRLQFSRLCEKQAVVNLSPHWGEVKGARSVYQNRVEVPYSVIPIYSYVSEYVDVDTGKTFMSVTSFSTSGGILVGRLGLGLGNSSQCLPKDLGEVFRKVNLDDLGKEGRRRATETNE